MALAKLYPGNTQPIRLQPLPCPGNNGYWRLPAVERDIPAEFVGIGRQDIGIEIEGVLIFRLVTAIDAKRIGLVGIFPEALGHLQILEPIYIVHGRPCGDIQSGRQVIA